jgi:hypothetical protein
VKGRGRSGGRLDFSKRKMRLSTLQSALFHPLSISVH